MAYCEEHNITYQAYSPLHGQGIAASPALAEIANSVAQIRNLYAQ